MCKAVCEGMRVDAWERQCQCPYKKECTRGGVRVYVLKGMCMRERGCASGCSSGCVGDVSSLTRNPATIRRPLDAP